MKHKAAARRPRPPFPTPSFPTPPHTKPKKSRDKPEDLGFPPVEPDAAKPAPGAPAKPKPSVLKQLVSNVLKNPFIWGMALTYFFIYVVRQVGVVCLCLSCVRARLECAPLSTPTLSTQKQHKKHHKNKHTNNNKRA